MLHYTLDQEKGILTLTPEGPLEAADFEEVAREVDPWIEAKGDLCGIIIHVKSFPGWKNFAALLTHFRFVRDHHQQVRRVAAVTDGTILSVAPEITRHFVRAKVEHFDYDQLDQALAWLQEPPK